MWWESEDEIVNMDNVCTVRKQGKNLVFALINGIDHFVDYGTSEKAAGVLHTITDAQRHLDEGKAGAVKKCSICTEGCEDALKEGYRRD